MEFANYRLVSNLLLQKKAKLKAQSADRIYVTDKQYVKSIQFKFDDKKVNKKRIDDKQVYISGDQEALNLLLDLYAEFYDEIEQLEIRLTSLPFKNEIQNYIVQKVNKILRTYSEYKTEFLIDTGVGYVFNKQKKLEFANALNKDNSHVTFKLKQALNYLRNCIYVQDLIKEKKSKEEDIDLELKWDESKIEFWFEFDLEELLNSMHTNEPLEIVRNIPPSIFEIRIELSKEEVLDSNQIALFSDLSSGEQQLIHSVNTVLYHLNNLNSVHFSGDGRLAFAEVNIVFDEIELYFHPEYQRKFVSYLLESINHTPIGGKEQGVKAINILFSTHSPFILSDIPMQNILMLEVDEATNYSVVRKTNEQTFGGNIHELLANSFFLGQGYIGAKAVEIINEVIKKLNNWTDNKDLEVNEKDRTYVKEVIKLIGNELVKGKLVEMFDERFGDQDFKEALAKEYELKAKLLRGDDKY